MRQLKISLVSLGSLKCPVDTAYLAGWSSQLITINHAAVIDHLPNAEGSDWVYTDQQLSTLIQADVDADITLGLINARLENNYYMRPLGNKVAVLSLFEMAEIIRLSGFTIEDFILRNIYVATVLYAANVDINNAISWIHDDVRGCLFDMNANKPDIVFSMHKPKLCDGCRSKIQSIQINSGFLPNLDKELSRIKKALYFRMSTWVKAHPLCALAITASSAVILNLIASVIFEKTKCLLLRLG